MSDKLTRLAVEYARAHEALRIANREYQKACSDIKWPMENDGVPDSMFFQDGERWRWAHSGQCPKALRGEVVDDPSDLAIIENWKKSYHAKVAAARRLGSLKGSILKRGKRLIRDGAR